MWPDNATEDDYLNFSGVAETVAEIIVQAKPEPISIGVSGAWGVGKSSMIKLIRRELEKRNSQGSKFLFVDFNAWLYQGYDDARAALMEVIGVALEEVANERATAVDKTKAFLKRVRWFRVVKLAGSAIAVAAGLPPVALAGDVVDVARRMWAGESASDSAEELKNAGAELADGGGLLKPKQDPSPPREIQALRDSFREALRELNLTLVVLIDDLDRCLPETTISTLEAIRLFLFIEGTAFVIAADERMIKYAVRQHFSGIEREDTDLATNYFDKLVQVPIRVPLLGPQEVRAYLLLLFVQDSSLSLVSKERIRSAVGAQLRQTWQGRRVDRNFVQSLGESLPSDLIGRLESADRLSAMMATASNISGNPRLIKRFLNALAIRMAISKAHGVGVDETVLAKMLLFERCGNPKAYEQLIKSVTADEQGKPRIIAEWENQVGNGAKIKLEAPWDEPFVTEWLALPPRLADRDLRGVLYVSREHSALTSPEDRVSQEGMNLLAALVEHPEMAASLKERLAALPKPELSVIMGRMLEQAQREQSWGVPKILEASLVIGDIDGAQGSRLAAFLSERPPAQITPAIVPKISTRPWAKQVFAKWETLNVDQPVKNAIKKVS
jgi:predicted KAP-like P-loop ATPase